MPKTQDTQCSDCNVTNNLFNMSLRPHVSLCCFCNMIWRMLCTFSLDRRFPWLYLLFKMKQKWGKLPKFKIVHSHVFTFANFHVSVNHYPHNFTQHVLSIPTILLLGQTRMSKFKAFSNVHIPNIKTTTSKTRGRKMKEKRHDRQTNVINKFKGTGNSKLTTLAHFLGYIYILFALVYGSHKTEDK